MGRKFVNISAEIFNGQTLWGSTTHYTLDERPHFGEDEAGWTRTVHESAAQSDCGYFVRESWEHGALWFPVPERNEFVGCGEILGALIETRGRYDVYLQFGLEHFIGSPGIFPVDSAALADVLTHRLPVGRNLIREDAMAVLEAHRKPYTEAKRWNW